MYLSFVDFEKAFDSVNIHTIVQDLKIIDIGVQHVRENNNILNIKCCRALLGIRLQDKIKNPKQLKKKMMF